MNSNNKGFWYLVALICVAYALSSTGHQASQSAAPALHGSYQDMARQAAISAGIPPDLFIKQIDHESGFNPDARGRDGEIGIAQLEPSTAAGLGVNPYDPASSLTGAAQMMARYYQRYGDYAQALAGYNCGGGCIAAAAAYGPSWGCHIPASTMQYIYAIMAVDVCQ